MNLEIIEKIEKIERKKPQKEDKTGLKNELKRILSQPNQMILHLLEYSDIAPFDNTIFKAMTRNGIAESCLDVDDRFIGQYQKLYKKEIEVIRRPKIYETGMTGNRGYYLTEEGKEKAKEILEEIKDIKIDVKYKNREKSMRLEEIHETISKEIRSKIIDKYEIKSKMLSYSKIISQIENKKLDLDSLLRKY